MTPEPASYRSYLPANGILRDDGGRVSILTRRDDWVQAILVAVFLATHTLERPAA